MSNEVFLLADIGGTNARFAITDEAGREQAAEIYKVRENPSLAGALSAFCDRHVGQATIAAAAFGVAGPVLDDVVRFTNSDWICDKKELEGLLKTHRIFILNDFEAIALAIGSLDPSRRRLLQKGVSSPRHPAVVLGPGTGLGVAALVSDENGFQKALTTEAGHTRLAPANERERKIIRYLARTYNFVSAEMLISGPGLQNLYQANCHLLNRKPAPLSAAEISAQARGGDQFAHQVLDDFAAFLGSFASQMALSWNALGGVYLAGGVLKNLGDLFDSDRFLERFNTNPRMTALLARVPVYWIQDEIPAYAGLLSLLRQKTGAWAS